VDIVARLRPSTTDREQVQIGRWAAVGIMLLSIAWSTQGEKFTSIFAAVQQIGAALAPPITAVFVMGVFSKRGGSAAALWTLMIGLILGVIGFLVDTPLVGSPPTRPLLAETRLLTDGLGIPFLRQAFFLTIISMVIFTVIAKLTPPPPKRCIEGLTWDNPLMVLTRPYRGAGVDPRHAAFALAATMVCLYVVFR
jgi:SSS family solute:Na+ symporter